AFQIARERQANDVGARRQELTELDVSRAEPRQRRRKSDRCAFRSRPLDQPRKLEPKPRGCGEGSGIREGEHTFAREYKTRARETKQMADRRDHKRQPECSATIPPLIIRCDTRRKPAARIISANALGRGKRRIDSTR